MSPQEAEMEKDHQSEVSAESSIGTEKETSSIRIVSPEKTEPEDQSTEDEDSDVMSAQEVHAVDEDDSFRANETVQPDEGDATQEAQVEKDDSTEPEESDKETEAEQESDTSIKSPQEAQMEHIRAENSDDETNETEQPQLEGGSTVIAEEVHTEDSATEEEAVEGNETVQPDGVDSSDGTALMMSSPEEEEQTAEVEEYSEAAEETEVQERSTDMSLQESQMEDDVAGNDDSVQANDTEQQEGATLMSGQEAQVVDSSVEEDSVELLETELPDSDESSDDETLKVMHESNQTAEERLQIRRTQRKLYSKVVEAGDDLDIEEVRGENNRIFKKVCYPREAVLDGMNMREIGKRATNKAERLVESPRYDADRIVRKLRAKCLNREGCFDWDAFGTQAGTCFNAMPANVSFLYGCVTHIREIKIKARPRRIQVEEEDAEEERPEEIRARTDGNADQLSAIQRNLKSMKKTLKQTVFRTYHRNKRKMQALYEGGEIPPIADKKLKKHGVEIDAVRFLFNPASFTQTVENIFHYSFLVKEGAGTLRVRKKGIGDNFGKKGAPGGLSCHYIEEVPKNPPNTQAIVSLTMKDWRDLVKAYDVKKGDLPYRVGSAQTKSVNLAQQPQQQKEGEKSSEEIKEGGADERVEESSGEIGEGGMDEGVEESSEEIEQGGMHEAMDEEVAESQSSESIEEGAMDEEYEESSSSDGTKGGVNSDESSHDLSQFH